MMALWKSAREVRVTPVYSYPMMFPDFPVIISALSSKGRVCQAIKKAETRRDNNWPYS